MDCPGLSLNQQPRSRKSEEKPREKERLLERYGESEKHLHPFEGIG